MTHVVILPYFSQQEIDRYVQIVTRIGEFQKQNCDYQFLLAASPKIETSNELYQVCSQVAKTASFQCPTQIFGYPEGPTAMFWDCMKYVHDNCQDDGGFSLWLESDMAPVKSDWLDQLDRDWQTGSPPLLMGCYVPNVYKQRLLRRRKLLLEDHVNGGACYAKHFDRLMPGEARQGVFDVAVYRFAKKLGRVKATSLIDFSTTNRVRRDVINPGKVLLHGFMQDKDQFIQECLRPVSRQEMRQAYLHPILDQWETTQRKLRVWMVRRGQQAMFENMLLAKQKDPTKRVA